MPYSIFFWIPHYFFLGLNSLLFTSWPFPFIYHSSFLFFLLITTLNFSILLASLFYYFSIIFLLIFFCRWNIQLKLRRYSYDPQQVRTLSLFCFSFQPCYISWLFFVLFILFYDFCILLQSFPFALFCSIFPPLFSFLLFNLSSYSHLCILIILTFYCIFIHHTLPTYWSLLLGHLYLYSLPPVSSLSFSLSLSHPVSLILCLTLSL